MGRWRPILSRAYRLPVGQRPARLCDVPPDVLDGPRPDIQPLRRPYGVARGHLRDRDDGRDRSGAPRRGVRAPRGETVENTARTARTDAPGSERARASACSGGEGMHTAMDSGRHGVGRHRCGGLHAVAVVPVVAVFPALAGITFFDEAEAARVARRRSPTRGAPSRAVAAARGFSDRTRVRHRDEQFRRRLTGVAGESPRGP